MLFVQNGTPWNTIQFFYYSLFFTSILAGIALSWINKKYLIIFIALWLLGGWATLQHYLPPKPQSMIPSAELEALNFLKSKPDGIVLTYPFDRNKSKAANFSPRPLYLYDSTAYVSAISKKQSFLDDEVNLNIMGYDWKTRREEVLEFISTLDIEEGINFLDTNNIKYLYLVKAASPIQGELFKLAPDKLGLEKIFENKEYMIFSYRK